MISFIIIAVVLFVFTYKIYAKHKHLNLQVFGKMASKFSESIQPLLQDDETPQVVLEFIGFMNKTIQNPKSARLVLKVITSKSGISEEQSDVNEIDAFFENRTELHEPFIIATFSYITAVTFNGTGIAGVLSRTFLKNMISRHKEMANTVVQDVYYFEKEKNSNLINRREANGLC